MKVASIACSGAQSSSSLVGVGAMFRLVAGYE